MGLKPTTTEHDVDKSESRLQHSVLRPVFGELAGKYLHIPETLDCISHKTW